MRHALKNAASKRLMRLGNPAGSFVPKETDGIREQSTN